MSGTPRTASPGTPPLLWSSVEEAFRNINQNFNDLYATIQADGSTQVVNFSQLYDDVSPAVTASYKLGDFDHTWKSLNLSPYLEIDGSNLNGLWLGIAHIVDDGTAVVLPSGSKVGNDLIIDPAKTFWKTFSIDNENFVEAADFADTLNINSGTAIQIVVDSSAESLTFNNTGVTSLIAGTGTSISSATGNITVTNTGVITLTNGSTLPAGLPAGSGISVSSAAGDISITNTGVLDIQNGFGITVSRDDATGIVTVTNNAPAQVAFRTIRVVGPLENAGLFDIGSDYIIVTTGTTIFTSIGSTSNSPGAVFTATGVGSGNGTARKIQTSLVADSTSDTLVVEAGYGMVITTNEITDDTLVLTVDQNIDITGSVFANDSSIIVDSIDQRIYAAGGVVGDLTGDTAGFHTGDVKGSVFGDDSTKIVDAVENKLYAEEITTTNGFITDLRSPTFRAKDIYAIDSAGVNITANGFNNLVVLETSVELQNVPVNVQNNVNITGTLNVKTIDTVDSSAITVVPPVNFNTDVNFENELFIQNSRVMAIDELKTIVAASTDFANFQARIAAL